MWWEFKEVLWFLEPLRFTPSTPWGWPFIGSIDQWGSAKKVCAYLLLCQPIDSNLIISNYSDLILLSFTFIELFSTVLPAKDVDPLCQSHLIVFHCYPQPWTGRVWRRRKRRMKRWVHWRILPKWLIKWPLYSFKQVCVCVQFDSEPVVFHLMVCVLNLGAWPWRWYLPQGCIDGKNGRGAGWLFESGKLHDWHCMVCMFSQLTLQITSSQNIGNWLWTKYGSDDGKVTLHDATWLAH